MHRFRQVSPLLIFALVSLLYCSQVCVAAGHVHAAVPAAIPDSANATPCHSPSPEPQNTATSAQTAVVISFSPRRLLALTLFLLRGCFLFRLFLCLPALPSGSFTTRLSQSNRETRFTSSALSLTFCSSTLIPFPLLSSAWRNSLLLEIGYAYFFASASHAGPGTLDVSSVNACVSKGNSYCALYAPFLLIIAGRHVGQQLRALLHASTTASDSPSQSGCSRNTIFTTLASSQKRERYAYPYGGDTHAATSHRTWRNAQRSLMKRVSLPAL